MSQHETSNMEHRTSNPKPETSNFIYGTRAVIEAIRAGKEIEKLLIQQDLNNPLMSDLKKLINENKIPIQYVPLQKLQRLTRGNHQYRQKLILRYGMKIE